LELQLHLLLHHHQYLLFLLQLLLHHHLLREENYHFLLNFLEVDLLEVYFLLYLKMM
jgi:hypothetical protein